MILFKTTNLQAGAGRGRGGRRSRGGAGSKRLGRPPTRQRAIVIEQDDGDDGEALPTADRKRASNAAQPKSVGRNTPPDLANGAPKDGDSPAPSTVTTGDANGGSAKRDSEAPSAAPSAADGVDRASVEKGTSSDIGGIATKCSKRAPLILDEEDEDAVVTSE